jgi:hypothetical protein
LSKLTILLWERKSNYDGVIGWVMLQKTITMKGLFPRRMPSYDKLVYLSGYDEDTNAIVLTTETGNFTLQLDSAQIRHIIKRDYICDNTFYPYTNFYTAGNTHLSTLLMQKEIQILLFARIHSGYFFYVVAVILHFFSCD